MAERAKILARDEPPRDPVATAQNPPPKVVIIGTLDSAEILTRYNVQLALAGRTDLMGLSGIAAPEDALAAIARPANATLH